MPPINSPSCQHGSFPAPPRKCMQIPLPDSPVHRRSGRRRPNMSETFKTATKRLQRPPAPITHLAQSPTVNYMQRRGVGALSQSGSSGEWGSFIPLGLEHAEKTGYSKSCLDSWELRPWYWFFFFVCVLFYCFPQHKPCQFVNNTAEPLLHTSALLNVKHAAATRDLFWRRLNQVRASTLSGLFVFFLFLI